MYVREDAPVLSPAKSMISLRAILILAYGCAALFVKWRREGTGIESAVGYSSPYAAASTALYLDAC